MAKSLAKIEKKAAKKKRTTGVLHENSKVAKKLRRAGARSEKLDKSAASRARTTQPLCKKERPVRSSVRLQGLRINFTFQYSV